MSVEKKVKAFIEKQDLIKKGDRVLLGLSGGADSVCLLYLLLGLREELGFALRAVHVHHGIRLEADEDQAYVESLCKKEGIFCYSYREDVPAWAKESGFGEEEAGRMLRYRNFEKSLELWREESDRTERGAVSEGERAENLQEGFCPENGLSSFKIATAHHENDQAETVLFQLFRGCGISGLRGILPKRGQIVRPILCLSRTEIENFLQEKGVTWCEDRTNQEENYSRNKIRHQILAYAEQEINSDAAAHIAKTAEILREAEEYIRKQTEAACRRIVTEHKEAVIFDIPSLRREDAFLQKQIFLYGFERLLAERKDIGTVHIEDMQKLMEKQGNGELCLPSGIRVKKSYQKLAVFRESAEVDGTALSEMSAASSFLYGEAEPVLKVEKIDLSEKESVKERLGIQKVSEILRCIPQKKYTKWFDYDKIKMPFSVRHWESGDYLTIDGKMNRKSFRRYMIENKIPASRRSGLWLLADGSHVIWAPGGRMSAYYKVTEQTKTILQIQVCTEE